MVHFEKDHLEIRPVIPLMVWKKTKIKYDSIERIELPKGDYVNFFLKNGKVKKVYNPAVVAFYPEFGKMLKEYKIAYSSLLDDKGYEAIETVRQKADVIKKTALSYANRSLLSNLGEGYEMEGKIVERIIGTTLEFRLLKDGVLVDEVNAVDSIEGVALIDEMDIAYLSEWDPETGTGLYTFADEVKITGECESYVEEIVLSEVYDCLKKDGE